MLFDAIEKKEKLDVCMFLFFFYDTFYPQIHEVGASCRLIFEFKQLNTLLKNYQT